MIFITATDTDVGKTFFSKSLIKYLIGNNIYDKSEIAYLKAVQCGKPTDYDLIAQETGVDIHTCYDLAYPASPDYAAKLENQEIAIATIKNKFEDLQTQYKYIIVEGAGGVAVPLNNRDLVSDLIKALELETVLVIRPDLGTINHSILSYEHLKAKKINIKGLFVSAKGREISEAYNVSPEEKTKQNNAALKTIVEFTKAKLLELGDFK